MGILKTGSQAILTQYDMCLEPKTSTTGRNIVRARACNCHY